MLGREAGEPLFSAMKTEKKSIWCNTYIITVLKQWASMIITCVIITVVIITIIIIIMRNNFILFWLTKLFRAFILFVITSVFFQ